MLFPCEVARLSQRFPFINQIHNSTCCELKKRSYKFDRSILKLLPINLSAEIVTSWHDSFITQAVGYDEVHAKICRNPDGGMNGTLMQPSAFRNF